MKPKLEFLTEAMQVSSLGQETAFPDILSGLNVQNKLVFRLEEDDEIYEGYGKLDYAYPYRAYTCYDRRLESRKVKTAVLENDFLLAVFLPEYGGRLWRLVDKITGSNLLYTNDVIRPSNLAVRNAWFSGGVEWNIGIIGHTPLTMEPLFTAVLENEDKEPVLRLYEYERIRKVTYQMDFWLEEKNRFLNCRMRIVNDTRDVIPMYWWSNMAVPEYEEGRVLLPAKEAYTSDLSSVYKVKLPMVEGVDVTRYNGIPNQVDYFFHIPAKERKYIANLNKEGYGLLHMSTDRLQSRKLFSWGHSDASFRWQEYLTENAGKYIEIQAGLGKTQYGCIPMAPNTAWEWMEQYGAVCAGQKLQELPFDAAAAQMDITVSGLMKQQSLQEKLIHTKPLAKTAGKVISKGSGYGYLENKSRRMAGEKELPAHLDFSSEDIRQKEWMEYLEKGVLNCPSPSERPSDFTADDIWFKRLKKSTEEKDRNNWYVHYQLGLQYINRKDMSNARKALETSERLMPSAWAKHGLAVCAITEGKAEEAVMLMKEAMKDYWNELSMVKECFRIYLQLNAYEEILNSYEKLSDRIRMESRIRFNYIQALAGTGAYEKAYALLMKEDGLEVTDLREGEGDIGGLWRELHRKIYGDGEIRIPHKLNFNSLI